MIRLEQPQRVPPTLKLSWPRLLPPAGDQNKVISMAAIKLILPSG